MNILIISETFYQGGLETHINTFYEVLKTNHNLYFLFGRYNKSNYLKDANITDGYNFSYNDNVKTFLQDVDRITEAIEKYNIDVVHAHPFYSVFPAIFACNKTNTKLVYTLHGRSSVNFFDTANISLLYSFAFENIFSKVFCVSKEVLNWLNDFKANNAEFLPNIVNEEIYSESELSLNKKWALISRLDADKSSEIIKFLKIINNLDIDTLDIFGNGSKRSEIEDLVNNLNCKCKINFKGYCDKIEEKISDGYTGVIGLGRVALEGLVKNLPVLLIGYNKIIGLIDSNIYNIIKNNNFIPGTLNDIEVSELRKQIEKVNSGDCEEFKLRNQVSKEFGIALIDVYLNSIENSKAKIYPFIDNLLEDLRNPELENEFFYTSEKVFNLFRKYFATYTHSFQFKNSINLYSEIFAKQNEIERLNLNLSIKQTEINELKTNYSLLQKSYFEYIEQNNKLIQAQNEEIDFLKRSMEYVNKTGLITILKRDFKKIKYKIFKK